jgi:hypothetical protein
MPERTHELILVHKRRVRLCLPSPGLLLNNESLIGAIMRGSKRDGSASSTRITRFIRWIFGCSQTTQGRAGLARKGEKSLREEATARRRRRSA